MDAATKNWISSLKKTPSTTVSLDQLVDHLQGLAPLGAALRVGSHKHPFLENALIRQHLKKNMGAVCFGGFEIDGVTFCVVYHNDPFVFDEGFCSFLAIPEKIIPDRLPGLNIRISSATSIDQKSQVVKKEIAFLGAQSGLKLLTLDADQYLEKGTGKWFNFSVDPGAIEQEKAFYLKGIIHSSLPHPKNQTSSSKTRPPKKI